MSIFKNTFSPSIKEQLKRRQEAVLKRDAKSIQYLNSRNAWVRMESSVDVDNDKGDLADRYVMFGGIIGPSYNKKDNSFSRYYREGVSSQATGPAYSTQSPKGKTYLRGLKPMPGIVSIDVKSKTAYGSLREVVVSFQCWDIAQLEDLELLYMRPGYTVLVEWGWSPYLKNDGELETKRPTFYEIINGVGGKNPSKNQIWQDILQKNKDTGGNYDAMFGYVKNYSWTARPDGGFDCQTTIISIGELMESLKVNYISPQYIINITTPIFNEFNPSFVLSDDVRLSDYYQKNKLAGIWAEIYFKLRLGATTYRSNTTYENKVLNIKSVLKDQTAVMLLPGLEPIGSSIDHLSFNSQHQVYITLEGFFKILENYIVPKDNKGDPLIKLSLNNSSITGDGSDLLCLAHPLQVSVDPTVCLIKSPLWSNKGKSIPNTAVATAQADPTIKAATDSLKRLLDTNFADTIYEQRTKQIEEIAATNKNIIPGNFLYLGSILQSFSRISGTIIKDAELIKNNLKAIYNQVDKDVLNVILNIRNSQEYLALDGVVKDFKLRNPKSNFNTLLSLINFLNPDSVQIGLMRDTFNKLGFGATLSGGILILTTPPQEDPSLQSAIELSQINKGAIDSLTFLNDLKQSYFQVDQYSELGIIKNIYVNLDFLYKQAININIENQDKTQKNEINIYNYVKSIIQEIQPSLGNVSNFEVHVSADDNTARIIDVNYTGPKGSNIYNNLFEFQIQIHNLESIVRTYSLHSQIFPEQGSLIAIGAQVQRGQLGMQSNTMIDFNRNLTDRIITDKIFPNGETLDQNNPKSLGMLSQLIKLFVTLKTNPVNTNTVSDLITLISSGKNSLRDLIVYFQSITKGSSGGRNIIPIKFSFEMDGIGGLIIGDMFKLPGNVIPKGYKGDGVGSSLGQIITSISHTVQNNDWVTKIDALNVIIDNKEDPNKLAFKDLDLTKIIEIEIYRTTNSNITSTKISAKNIAPKVASFGSVSNSVPLGVRPFLDTIAYAEGLAGVGQNGYDVIVGFQQINGWVPNYLGDHPNIPVFIKSINDFSTAAGRYQFLNKVWSELGYKTFDKENQDKAAWDLLRRANFSASDSTKAFTTAESQIKNNSIDLTSNHSFLKFLNSSFKIWASLPNSNNDAGYANQGGKISAIEVYNIYIEAVKKYIK
jgi:muramidase (phage lysozyme)